ncbi:angiotensin-converting enzyme-like [Branchiostoma floridae x Branchiostoma japonicum]
MARFILHLSIVVVVLFSVPAHCQKKNESEGVIFLEEYDTLAKELQNRAVIAGWNYQTDLTDENAKKQVELNLEVAKFAKEAATNASEYDWENFSNVTVKRLFSMITTLGTAALEDEEKLEQLNNLLSEMEEIYSTGQACEYDDPKTCLDLNPGLEDCMADSTDYNRLLFCWEGWRDAAGRRLGDLYSQFVELSNEAVRADGWNDTGEYWRSWYETEDFQQQLETIYQELQPLYQNLHAYVRRKLIDTYGAEMVNAEGPIPAHLLGNMWAQTWGNIYNLVIPFPNKPSIDVTDEMVRQGYDALRMFNLSDQFFREMGQIPMPDSFWERTMFVRPDDREVVCHASAWDFYLDNDVRIKMCTKVNQEDLVTVHHEMGHIEYFLQYAHQPLPFREGANPGFHEAVGDLLALSVSTPAHLNKVGLLPELVDDPEVDINFLMQMALEKIAFLPFGYLIDQWRWRVFDGSTAKDKYNEEWWKLRTQYQGIVPPVPRNPDKDFDAGSKYHVPANTPYIRYFVSFVIQFQFHEAMCSLSGYTGDLHKCDASAGAMKDVAGSRLAEMLRMGKSQPWPEAFEVLTGDREMSAAAILQYFAPLIDWLEKQNENETLGWDNGWTPPYDCEGTGGFTCLDGSRCVRPADKCDGIQDCDDNSDEDPILCETPNDDSPRMTSSLVVVFLAVLASTVMTSRN